MSTKVKFNCMSVSDVKRAIEEVKAYQSMLKEKCNLFCERLSDIGISVASAKIAESPLGKYITITTNMHPKNNGYTAIIKLVGETKQSEGYEPINTLLMVEFGVGIYHNSTPNPLSAEYGYGVGTFPNQTHAFEDGWFYPKDNGEWGYTNGVKATMPIYHAETEMMLQINSIAREVFRS